MIATVTGVLAKAPGPDPERIGDVVWGCANGAGEDNRNVGRMAVLLAGLPPSVPAVTVNRLCGSSGAKRQKSSRITMRRLLGWLTTVSPASANSDSVPTCSSSERAFLSMIG